MRRKLGLLFSSPSIRPGGHPAAGPRRRWGLVFVVSMVAALLVPISGAFSQTPPPPECNGLPATIIGTAGDDNLSGTAGDDVIVGLGGNDTISGKAGDDTICGGDGDDNLDGNAGNDYIAGGDGDDNINGNNGDDYLDGGGDDDKISGNNGSDTLIGRSGTNTLDGGNGIDTCDVGEDGTERRCENDRPVANPVSVDAVEDGPPVDGNFDGSDPDGVVVTYSILTAPAEGSVVNNNDGTFTFDPGGDFQDLMDGETRDVSFDYEAVDVLGAASDPATVTVTVTGVDDLVDAVDDAYSTDEETTLAVPAPGLLANDDLGDGTGAVTPVVDGQTSLGGGLDVAADGSFTFDPDGQFEYLAAGEGADATFEYELSDTASSDIATVTITVEGVNDTPTADGQFVSNTAATFSITLTGSDPDSSDDLDFSIVSGPPAGEGTLGAVVNSNGTCAPAGSCTATDKNSATVEYTRPENSGAVFTTFTFEVDDTNGGTATAVVTINPELDPTPEPNADPPGVEGVDATDEDVETLTDVAVDLIVSAATDAPGDLQFGLESGPTGGVLSAFTPIDPDGAGPLAVRSASATYTPPTGATGTFSFEFRAAEVGNLSNFDVATVTIRVDDPAPPVPPVLSSQLATTPVDTGVEIDLASAATPQAAEPDLRGTPSAGPDLVVESLTHSPLRPLDTDEITFTVVVKNIGGATTGVGSTLSLEIPISNQGFGYVAGTTHPIPVLAAGASETIVRTVTVADECFSPGLCNAPSSAFAFADIDNDVAELDESNNAKFDPFTVYGAGDVAQPGFQYTIISLPDEGQLLIDGVAVVSTPAVVDRAVVTYDPPSGFAGTASFEYRLEDLASELSATTTVYVQVGEVAGLAANLTLDFVGTGTGTVTTTGNQQCTGNDPVFDLDGNQIGEVPCSLDFSAGVVTLNARPDPGWVFNGWGGDCAGFEFRLRVPLPAACTVEFGPPIIG